ncbi:hypothetical protein PMJ10TS2_38220 [Paenibacillus melissococcoides]
MKVIRNLFPPGEMVFYCHSEYAYITRLRRLHDLCVSVEGRELIFVGREAVPPREAAWGIVNHTQEGK